MQDLPQNDQFLLVQVVFQWVNPKQINEKPVEKWSQTNISTATDIMVIC